MGEIIVKKNSTTFLIIICVFGLLILQACKKSFNAKPTYRGKALAGIWAKTEPYYYPGAQYLDSGSTTWRNFLGFAFTSEGEPDVLGFYNPYVQGKGTNCLGMKTLYSGTPHNLTNDSGFYSVQIPKCFKFVPDNPTATVGNVNVIPQIVKCVKVIGKVPFNVPISAGPNPGRYNEITKTFEVDVVFDEREIGGSPARLRKYRFSSN
jgi:hypothetical protein